MDLEKTLNLLAVFNNPKNLTALSFLHLWSNFKLGNHGPSL